MACSAEKLTRKVLVGIVAKLEMHISDIDYANDNTMNLSLEDREKLALTRYVKSFSL